MKISVQSIIIGHIATLKKPNGQIAAFDIVLFFGIPTLMAVLSYVFKVRLSKDFHSLSVTLFGIFAPLLLNIQVAVFSIFQRKWMLIHDEKLTIVQQQFIRLRKELLSQLNSNISYLTLVSCSAIALSIIFYATGANSRVFSLIMVFIYVNFFLTLLMIVKRSHVLFQKEYETD